MRTSTTGEEIHTCGYLHSDTQPCPPVQPDDADEDMLPDGQTVGNLLAKWRNNVLYCTCVQEGPCPVHD